MNTQSVQGSRIRAGLALVSIASLLLIGAAPALAEDGGGESAPGAASATVETGSGGVGSTGAQGGDEGPGAGSGSGAGSGAGSDSGSGSGSDGSSDSGSAAGTGAPGAGETTTGGDTGGTSGAGEGAGSSGGSTDAPGKPPASPGSTEPASTPEGDSIPESAAFGALGAESTDETISLLASCPVGVFGGFEIDGNLDLDCGDLDWNAPVGDITSSSGNYQSSPADSSNPNGWNQGGSPAQDARISAARAYSRVLGGTTYLYAGINRASGNGTSGFSIEITNAGQNVVNGVPRPNRGSGGVVLFLTQSGNSLTVDQACRYTSQSNYPGTCEAAGASEYLAAANESRDFIEFGLNLNALVPNFQAACPATIGSTVYIRSHTGTSKNLQMFLQPLTITPPSSCGTATLKITKIGDRTGGGTTDGSPIPGATFTAYGSTSGGSGQPTAQVLGSCITDAGGVCTIPVSRANTNGVWVVETGVPGGWRSIGSLGRGDYNATKTDTPYRFRVPITAGSGNLTIDVTKDKDLPSGTTVSGAWVNARGNPAFPDVCGVDIALVFDTSLSIDSGDMTTMKSAARAFVEVGGLGNTPSRVRMFAFDTTARTLNSGNAYDLSIPGSAQASNTTVGYNGASNGIGANLPSSGSGYTNWDDAFRLVKSSGSGYDLVVFLTDGDPTTYGAEGSVQNTNVQFTMVEQAVLSANAVKAMTGPKGGNTRIVVVGIDMRTNSDLNIKAISGTGLGDDYYLAANFSALKDKLQQIATRNCGGSVTVVKKTVDHSGATIDENASGWTFTASTTGNFIKTPTGNVSSLSRTTAAQGQVGEGTVNFPIDLSVATSKEVRIVEPPVAGWTPQSVSCSGASQTGTAADFKLTVERNAIVTCTVTNKQDPVEAQVTVSKAWMVNGEPYANGSQPEVAGSAELLLDESPGVFGNAYTRTVGTTVAISEEYTAGSRYCSLDSSTIAVGGVTVPLPAAGYEHTVAATGNDLTITNTVTCETKLTLLKHVAEGSNLTPSDWTLTAAPPTGPALSAPGSETEVPTGPTANTFDVDPGVEYTLSEAVAAGSTLAYRNLRLERLDSGGQWVEVAGSTVSVPLGEKAVYRFVNDRVPEIAVPLTGGLPADLFGLIGIAALVIAAAALINRDRKGAISPKKGLQP